MQNFFFHWIPFQKFYHFLKSTYCAEGVPSNLSFSSCYIIKFLPFVHNFFIRRINLVWSVCVIKHFVGNFNEIEQTFFQPVGNFQSVDILEANSVVHLNENLHDQYCPWYSTVASNRKNQTCCKIININP